MTTHSSILTWRIPWTEEPGELLCPKGHKESDMTERLTHTSTPLILFRYGKDDRSRDKCHRKQRLTDSQIPRQRDMPQQ